MFRIINLHNKNRQLGALKGLKEIFSLIDLWNISRLDDTKSALNVAVKRGNVFLRRFESANR